MPNRAKIFTRGLLHASTILRPMRGFWRGYTTWRYRNPWTGPGDRKDAPDQTNPLRLYFDEHTTGPGIWKWRHYFEVYDRHLGRFRDRPVRVLEIGIYSGGSLQMWRNYFGPGCEIYGIDIESACKAYENESVRVFSLAIKATVISGRDSNKRFRPLISLSTTAVFLSSKS